MQIGIHMDDFVKQPCERCGSKKRISKPWKDTIPTLSGTTVVEYAQITCTNLTCQSAFDENLEKEKNKREVIRLQKETNHNQRKENSLLMANKAKILKKNRSRI